MSTQQAVALAIQKLSSAKDPFELLEELWVETFFELSFDAFCAEVARQEMLR